ncbi:amino acid ABC transporter substrate-binding protein [Pseudomaricurvus alkylphenolicus]|nr:transporter substrate-binding domain-containing protein [Pseudomaricurvus alkylphenolicus]NIB41097.1 amino acid ABC transporter substrate-binding protein [Pseudomaricurvus alkylphenolicus]
MAIVVSSLLFTVQSQAESVLRYAFAEYPPWAYRENDKIKGLEYELVKAVVLEMGLELEATLVPNRRSYLGLLQQSSDFKSGPATPSMLAENRKNNLYTTGVQLYRVKICLASLRGKSSPGRRVGHVRIHSAVEKDVSSPNTSNVKFTNSTALLKALLSGRIDYAFDGMVSLMYGAKVLNLRRNQLVLKKVRSVPITMYWSKSALGSRYISLSRNFDQNLENLKQSGVVAEILVKYGKLEYFSDYGETVAKQTVY